MTIRLALDDGPEAQFGLVAVEVSPVSAVPAVSALPLVCPELALHSTVYGTVSEAFARVKALPAPLPDAVTL